MPFVNNQDVWVSGTRVYYQRDPIVFTPGSSAVPQPIIDLGELTETAPAVATTDVTLYTSDGGTKRPIAVVRTAIDETYEFETKNLSMDMWALAFSANPPTTFSQTATPITATHYATPESLLKLVDADGVPVYGVSSVTSVGSLTEGTDYQFVLPERGFIKFLPGGAFVTPGDLTITYVPRAITTTQGVRRLVSPYTQGCVTTGTAMIFWGRCGNQQQTVRECRVALAPAGNTIPEGNFGTIKFKLTELTDPTLDMPDGRLLYWLGDVPPVS
jgi:hypothetical protein